MITFKYFTCIKQFSFIRSSRTIFKMTDITSNNPDIRTFIFLDTETTGLPQWENNKTKITELCMIAVQASHIRLGVFPRVQNKLNFCFNPWKLIDAEAEKITGLSNGLLENQCKFSSETVDAISCFLNHNPKPICFVAHNGEYFDYPILRSEINKADGSLVEDIFCIDSIKTFRDIFEAEMSKELAESQINSSLPLEFTGEYNRLLCDLEDEVDSELPKKMLEVQKLNETTPKKKILEVPSVSTPFKKLKMENNLECSRNIQFGASLKLTDVYKRLTKRSPINEHHAEGDVNMLITCAATLGDKFVDWANANAKKFCDIPPMVAGKKIGT